MAKLACAFLVLALIATPFLNAMEAAAAGRRVPGGRGGGDEKDDGYGGKLYGGSKFFWWGLPWGLGLLHPWLFGPGPFWWLKDVKSTNNYPEAFAYDNDNGQSTNPNNNPEAFAYDNDNGQGSTSEVANFAPATSHSP